MRKITLFLFLLGSCLLLSSCIPDSDQPLSALQDSIADGRLGGVWVSLSDEPDETTYLHFAKDQNHTTDLLMVNHTRNTGTDLMRYKMFSSKIGDYYYMNLKFWDLETNQQSPAYVFAKYDISRDNVLTVWFMGNVDFIIQAIEKGQLQGVFSKGGLFADVRITDSSSNLAAFIRDSDHDELFSEFARFHKIHEGFTQNTEE